MTNAFSLPSVLLAPDHLAEYVNAFQAGKRLSGSSTGANTVNDDTPGAQDIAARTDLQPGPGAVRRADILTAFGQGLASVPYPQRAAVLAHLAPTLEKEGIPRSLIANFDPTDEALIAATDQARGMAERLAAR